ncbi:SDR family NAD(P)-dependent oxidoreductase [Enterovirga rhinocerotis]|uniref:NAD(P)-dependent dehydrogenase (Short-subunit alcohol dehydrogenase family) n=1 Tax=Enterovirga rhinocerotis TaxID=1339210 RepID=A0A4R7C7U2_9HYPH|nr:SDR family oxidoreductase [Enterovirga rhinocerotis]TDR92886.1 NAD(P)-dependent dehydrogenase (short-subunit alcohol dehydrogenase family) [Enterovirga rhinocerotis]
MSGGIEMEEGTGLTRTSEPIAVIVGGANGIGAATARVMRARGWVVVIGDRDMRAGEELARELGGAAYEIDVAEAGSLAALAEISEREIGATTALIVSSGVFQPNEPIETSDAGLFEQITRINLAGTYHADRAFGTRMAARGRGSIVNLSSVTGHGSTPLNIYAPTKAAIINLSKSLAGEWGRSGVRVNSVSPGITLVPRVVERKRAGNRYPADLDQRMALGRCVEPSEVGEAVEFLASDRASAITGTDLVVDCGWITASLWEAYGGTRPPRQGG